ncbi:MAG: PD40 domain-containing protein [Verrucomicrobia bacterium]|nr:PD40 domain-containing protein [Verrucomicrobiota bacterium]
MTTPHSIPLAILVLLLLASAAPAAESLSVLLQKGIFAEETEGNLETAIKIYEDIVKDGDANRSLVAQAQYRLAMCRLKQGKEDEAVTAFRKLIVQFYDAADLVAKSRDRLVELGQPAGATVVRRVWSGPDAAGDKISADGRHLAFVDWNTGNIAVRDLVVGQTRRVTEHGVFRRNLSQYAESCAISRDGTRIAYSWFGTNRCYGLHAMSLEDPAPSRLLITMPTNGWVSAEDWSPDGKSIAVFVSEKQGTQWHGGISLVSVADGTLRKVAPTGERTSMLRFSPDGRYLAYSVARNPNFRRGHATNDIWLVDVESGSVKLAVEHLAQEQLIGWAPRGSEILFLSERRGTKDVWSIQVDTSDSKPAPRLLKANVGDLQCIGLTRDGGFFYLTQSNDARDIYVASVDLNSGKLLSTPKEAPGRINGPKTPISLSPDGRKLAFFLGATGIFAIQNIETGTVLEIAKAADITFVGSGTPRPVWSPDSHRLVVRAYTKGFSEEDRRHGLFLLDATTGASSVVSMDPQFWGMDFKDGLLRFFLQTPESGQARVRWVSLDISTRETHEQDVGTFPNANWPHRFLFSSDDKQLFYLQIVTSAEGMTSHVAVRRDRVTGQEIELFRSNDKLGFLGRPNAEGPIVIGVFEAPDPGHLRAALAIKGIEVTENSAKERFSVELPQDAFVVQMEGSHCKSHVLLGTYLRGAEPKTEIWTLSRKDGSLKKTEITLEGLVNVLGCDTEGRQLAYQTFDRRQRLSEVWVMENFLPPIAATK